jgi:Ser/Thr protein kinase RdoA (MazF antagonist)
MLEKILQSFGLNATDYQIQFFGSGLINHTFKVSGRGELYILQQINGDVFKTPHAIANNLTLIQDYLNKLYPDYLFVGPIPALSGDLLVASDAGKYYRLFPFIKGSQTINFITNEKEAFEAAKQFGKFTYLLKDFDANQLEYTLTDFHNLELRFAQFESAEKNAEKERTAAASAEIKEVYKHNSILQTYRNILANKEVPVRVIHHDTKISNVLFDDQQNGLCVIDLDTVMPGYFFSDVGDMMRTYLSPANEEETDFSKIHIREAIFSAICRGYLSEMGSIFTEKEKQYFVFSGELMIYMQAIRFLTDYLNNDIYYGAKYPDHNLNRAKNQFKLLNEYVRAEGKFKKLIKEAEREL